MPARAVGLGALAPVPPALTPALSRWEREHDRSEALCHLEMKVEPGGVEPPCRNSQRAASTRVVVLKVSAQRSANDGVPLSHDTLCLASHAYVSHAMPARCLLISALSGVEH